MTIIDNISNIQRAQRSLNALGYRADDSRELPPDGEFGPRTRSAALKFQNERMPEPPTDGMIAPRTMIALARYAEYLDSLDDDRHPCHAMYGRAMDGVSRLPPPCPRDDVERGNVAAALTLAARRSDMDTIDHIVASSDGRRVFAVQGDLDSPSKRIAEVDLDVAIATPAENSRVDLSHQAAFDFGAPVQEHEQRRVQQL